MKLRAWLLWLVSFLTAGCASSSLTVSVDLYDEDPRLIAPMSLETAYRLIDDVNQLEAAAREKTAQRAKLAEMAWEAYRATTQSAGMSSREVEQAYKSYAASVADREKTLADPFSKARAALTKYIAQYQAAYAAARTAFESCERYRVASDEVRKSESLSAKECRPIELAKQAERLGEEWTLRRLPPALHAAEAEARNAVSEAVAAYRAFAGPTQTTADAKSKTPGDEFTVPWAQLRAQLNANLERAQRGGFRVVEAQIDQAIRVMNAKVTELAAAIKAIEPERAKSPGPPRERVASSSALLLDSVARIAVELDAVRADLPESASARTALAGLAANATRFVELIDRLQDPGNPVWRIVTDPANEAHWNTESVKTRFYAEGKSHVVMVRNDPMRFDVQEGTNNPAALIKGQLEVTRAIANAAIGVLGASTGLPVRKPPAAGETESPATTGESSAAEDFARRKAVADESAQARERAIRGLSLELANVQSNLNAVDDASLTAQRARLAAILSAYQSIFKAAKD
jgi:hypothetical protein